LTFSEKAFNFFQVHLKKLVVGVTAAVILAVLILGSKAYLDLKADQAQAAYSEALAELTAKENLDAAEIEKAVRDLKKVVEDYSGYASARCALVDLGSLSYQLGRYDQAVRAYQSFLQDLRPEEEIFRPLVLDSLAHAFECQDQFRQAADHWEKILTLPGTLLKQEAYLSLGRVYEAQGLKDKAVQAYQELVARFPNSFNLPLAEAKLAELNREK